jgi:glycosyltransferase involved in cell wall biosynthesis
MNILVVHNYYQQRGGEDVSTESEIALLREHGHHVELYSVHNDLVDKIGKLRSALRAVWSVPAYRDVKRILSEKNYDVMHVQNFFPLISPSVYFAAKSCGVPVVQSIRNYRLFCLNGFFFINGSVCERCFKRTFAWPGIKRKCYRNNRSMSCIVALMQFVHHHILRSWLRKVDRFVALSEFVKKKLIEAGIPEEKITVKPNFVLPDPGPGASEKKQLVFVGRLSPEKGIDTLLAAWTLLQKKDALTGHELIVIGEGPERTRLEQLAVGLSVKFTGQKPTEEVYEMIGDSRGLIFPSEWYETFGRVAVEAYAEGVPVIASAIGAVQELVIDGETGFLFEPGSAADLAEKIEWLINHPEEAGIMGRRGRMEFEQKFSAVRNIEILRSIYEEMRTL